MTDEIVAPLMDNYENQEEKNNNDILPKKEEVLEVNNRNDNDNELAHLLNNRVENRVNRRNIEDRFFRRINLNINLNLNFNFNEDQKKGLIYLSYTIQSIIFLILISKFFDKVDFINTNIEMLYYLSTVILLSLIIFHYNYTDTSSENFFFLILAIISSFGMYIFMYKVCFLMTLEIFTYLMIVFIATCFSQYIIYFYFYNFNRNDVLLFFTALIVMILLSIIYEIIFFGSTKIGECIIIFLLVFYGYCASLVHIDILFKRRNIRRYHYPIIHTSLHYDMFIMFFFYLLSYESR